MTPKQRMLAAYRGLPADTVPVAPEFWYYYPAKLLGVDMIEFAREVPFHLALKQTFEAFACEGWGVTFPGMPNEHVEGSSCEKWISDTRLEVRSEIKTPAGTLTSASLLDREEPGWPLEHPLKDFARDLAAWEIMSLSDPDQMQVDQMIATWEEVGESYLLECWLGVPFFDFYGSGREGGMERAIFDLFEHEAEMEALREKHLAHMVHKARVLCERTPFESLAIGCAWSCNSLLGPRLWRRWDKPVIRAVADEIHRHGRLLHVHFHGKCLETVADFAEIGIDCVCPFERPPGGDVEGLEGLREVRRLLSCRAGTCAPPAVDCAAGTGAPPAVDCTAGTCAPPAVPCRPGQQSPPAGGGAQVPALRNDPQPLVTMNGNIHTVETLIRGTPDDVRREVREVWEAFRGTNRVIIGTGDQVGRETPEENLWAMIEEARACGPS